MNNFKDLPVLILGYNRFDKFTRCITTLKEQGIKKIYVFIDGPKNYFDIENQEKIIDFCLNNKLDLNIKLKKLVCSEFCVTLRCKLMMNVFL